MKFEQAYLQMLKGKKITRPCFEGHWYINGQTGEMVIHTSDGKDIREGKSGLTAINTLAEDWEVLK